jgi:GTP pyrophosphokinase
MAGKKLSFSQVTDIYGFRVVVPDITDCYTGMGLLHQIYKPVPGKFRDYVSIPKVNGYQSLHTTLIGPVGTNIEFQLRTQTMDVVAESGVAAHWLYKANEPGSEASQRLGSQWLQSLLDIQQSIEEVKSILDGN